MLRNRTQVTTHKHRSQTMIAILPKTRVIMGVSLQCIHDVPGPVFDPQAGYSAYIFVVFLSISMIEL